MRVIAAVTDLFFKARITTEGVNAKAEVGYATTAAGFAERARAGPIDLIVVDLNAAGFDPVALIRGLRQEPALGRTPILAFFSHVQVDLKRAAEEAGASLALPRSAFVQRLPGLLAGTQSV